MHDFCVYLFTFILCRYNIIVDNN
uniref:Putative transposase n=1 Tax=Arsenophonus nasoniae TaxID=638 RepID=D2TWL9_9GAMM|nr:putative transposase [Arsenophonus nasoniae]